MLFSWGGKLENGGVDSRTKSVEFHVCKSLLVDMI